MILTRFKMDYSTTKALTEYVNEINPLGYDKEYAHTFYEYKIKRLLTDAAVGMMPSEVWSGMYDATGGYLVVKKDGEVVCYHLYNRNLFENYLFESTYFDTASTSKYKFGEIYLEKGKPFFKLNLLVRFK